MQRLTRARARDERGASAVIFAILSVVLMGFAAIALDVGMMHIERQQLQTGADAAALAIAEDCADGDCRVPRTTAEYFVDANVNSARGDVEASLVNTPTPADRTVTVTASGTAEHLFAPILGIDRTQIAMSSTATWDDPSTPATFFPVGVGECEMAFQTARWTTDTKTVYTIRDSMTSDAACEKKYVGQYSPGSFGYLHAVNNVCSTPVPSSDRVLTGPNGNQKLPGGCTNKAMQDLLGETILIPVFNEVDKRKGTQYFRISGYAEFQLTGYFFKSSVTPQNTTCEQKNAHWCIHGRFLGFVKVDTDADLVVGDPVVRLELESEDPS